MGIDPVTHKPISQVLSDYGNNINSFPNTDQNLIGSFGKNLRNTNELQNNPSASDNSSFSQPPFFLESESQITPNSSPFSWSEFLLSNPAIHEIPLQQEENKFPEMSPTRPSTMAHQEEISHCKLANGELDGFGAHDCCSSTVDASSSSSASNSFIDAILDRDSEILSQFPQLLDGSFDY